MKKRPKRPLRLDLDAEAEIESATKHYERERKGLGGRLQDALLATFDEISEFPRSFSPVMKTRAGLVVRRALVDRFAYMVVYVELSDALRVVAVAHVRRRPRYWSRRLERR